MAGLSCLVTGFCCVVTWLCCVLTVLCSVMTGSCYVVTWLCCVVTGLGFVVTGLCRVVGTVLRCWVTFSVHKIRHDIPIKANFSVNFCFYTDSCLINNRQHPMSQCEWKDRFNNNTFSIVRLDYKRFS